MKLAELKENARDEEIKYMATALLAYQDQANQICRKLQEHQLMILMMNEALMCNKVLFEHMAALTNVTTPEERKALEDNTELKVAEIQKRQADIQKQLENLNEKA